jgi:hypothetical protein
VLDSISCEEENMSELEQSNNRTIEQSNIKELLSKKVWIIKEIRCAVLFYSELQSPHSRTVLMCDAAVHYTALRSAQMLSRPICVIRISTAIA